MRLVTYPIIKSLTAMTGYGAKLSPDEIETTMRQLRKRNSFELKLRGRDQKASFCVCGPLLGPLSHTLREIVGSRLSILRVNVSISLYGACYYQLDNLC